MLGRSRDPARRYGRHLGGLADIGALDTTPGSVVPSEVHLPTPRVGDHEQIAAAGCLIVHVLRDRIEAADTVDRNPEASPNAAAVTIPTRNPVNGPGPTPTTIASRSAGRYPASSRHSRICGVRISA